MNPAEWEAYRVYLAQTLILVDTANHYTSENRGVDPNSQKT